MTQPIALVLEKGETVVLKGEQKVSGALIGLGWDPRKNPGDKFDLDAVLIARDAAGKALDVLYYNSPKNGQGKPHIAYAVHSGDSLTGEGEMDASGDDEQITIPDFKAVPPEVNSFDVVVIIYDAAKRKQTFGDVSKAHVRLVNIETGVEVIRFSLTDDTMFDAVATLFARIVRKGPTWEFRAENIAKPWANVQLAINDLNPA